LKNGQTQRGCAYCLPKFPKSLDALFGRVTRDERGIDGANRNSGDLIRVEIGLGESLIGAESTTPLQEQRNALERRTFFLATRFLDGGPRSRHMESS